MTEINQISNRIFTQTANQADKNVINLIKIFENPNKTTDERNNALVQLAEIAVYKTEKHQDLKDLQIAFKPLLEVLENDTNVQIRSNAAAALAVIGKQEAAPYLIKALNERKNDSIRPHLIDMIGWWTETQDKAIINKLITILQGNNETIGTRSSAAGALGYLGKPGDKSITTPLLRVLKNEPNLNYHIQADTIEALGKLGASEAVPTLIEIFNANLNTETKEKSQKLFETIPQELGKLGGAETINHLLQGTYSNNPFTRRGCVNGLGLIASRNMFKSTYKNLPNAQRELVLLRLNQMLKNEEDKYVRESINKTLEKFEAYK